MSYHRFTTLKDAQVFIAANDRSKLVAKPYCPTIYGRLWPAVYLVLA